jgi:hypothetical protein
MDAMEVQQVSFLVGRYVFDLEGTNAVHIV